MGLINKKILGVKVTFSQKGTILEEIEKYLLEIRNPKSEIRKKRIKPLVIFTPNPEIINYTGKDKKFKEIVNTSQINLPDSSGVVWAAKKIHQDEISKISGSDFVWDLVKMAAKKGFTIGLIGGENGVALNVCECLHEKYSALKVEVLGNIEVQYKGAGIKYIGKKEKNDNSLNSKYLSLYTWNHKALNADKYFGTLIKTIKKKKITVLFVALGHPKQEYFINSVKREALRVKISEPLVMMAVGGTFDYISGRMLRAPLFLRNMGLEWLFRLVREPQRLGRQIRGSEFFFRVLRETSKFGC